MATLFGAGLLIALYGCQRRFAADIRQIATGPAKALEICTVRQGVAFDCRTFQEGSKPFADVLGALADARATLPPGKVPITRERILRVRSSDSSPGRYARCFRLIEFTGVPEEYLNDVAMDDTCTRIAAYGSGYAAARHIE